METVSKLIVSCRKKEKPLVFDADGLFIITQNPDLIRDYKHTILTPNAMELSRLIGDSGDKMNLLIEKLGRNCVILEKSDKDRIYDTKSREIVECSKGGSNRRSGGQGDLLAGSLATFFHWSLNLIDKNVYKNDENPAILSCYAASYLIKYCNKLSYDEHGRSMTAFDMIGKISHAFKEHFENE
jgi:ATP-dependent NAD(P)H-hydrate dehydratase